MCILLCAFKFDEIQSSASLLTKLNVQKKGSYYRNPTIDGEIVVFEK